MLFFLLRTEESSRNKWRKTLYRVYSHCITIFYAAVLNIFSKMYMCLHLVTVAVPRYQAKKLFSGGAKVLKNLEEETGKTLSHSSLHCSL